MQQKTHPSSTFDQESNNLRNDKESIGNLNHCRRKDYDIATLEYDIWRITLKDSQNSYLILDFSLDVKLIIFF